MRGIIMFLIGTLVVIVGTSILLYEDEGEVITIGASSGPFADMATYALKPVLEEEGYTVEIIEYSDYIQPNNALANGDLDANLFQNVLFMESYNEENDADLKNIVQVPTAPMGLYSSEYDSVEDISSGSEVALPLDPVNSSRGFLTLQDAGLITISEDADMFAIEEADIIDNKKNLEFIFQDAGQLPRSVDQIGLSLVPGNFALASEMNLDDALTLENMNEYFRNQIVINKEDEGSKLEEDLLNAVQSDEFNEVIDADFKGFDKPEEDE
ncbi:D-methionine-binding lipoprotein MetQ precursor [Jeotgalicoccus aerolatus]|uniref:D-methionine transport system substrate-binding protein n=1 Tax=Jeotgalicoccus aerolatus TaxID=709510 RepID=A0ABS4HL07_9STAP|nr:MetQ/NlpA family ABC transporter substrate-binding protein [Jeotgalicoccus aerolatus]MBP1951609.1 D-methionine transport system substrate-binding protein [Jeotgalicoccus aerolatus]GGD96157.1 metal ABC transporter substrate-binding protein [Jeotgalicoccus aerolatus]CAD2075959.1 D-methionine-binding lipoprotein MetQ precursor [Jeotgalicoccus aerolatus]